MNFLKSMTRKKSTGSFSTDKLPVKPTREMAKLRGSQSLTMIGTEMRSEYGQGQATFNLRKVSDVDSEMGKSAVSLNEVQDLRMQIDVLKEENHQLRQNLKVNKETI